MKKNIGTSGRIVRLLIALVLLGMAYQRHSWLLLLGGIFVLAEAFLSWCIIYQILGINACPRK